MLSVKLITKLQQKKYRQEYSFFVVEGKRAVTDALESETKVVQLVVTNRFKQEQRDFFQSPKARQHAQSGAILEIGESTFAKMVDSITPQGIAAVVQLPSTSLTAFENTKLIAVLEDIRDPGNLGTMIRTADWFGIGGLLLVGGADPYQPKVVRASMGSLFHVPLVISQNAIGELNLLKEKGFTLVVTRPELAQDQPKKLVVRDKLCLVFGSEAHGTSTQLDALADQSWSIPKFGSAESLNVAVSFGITMYALKKHG